MKKITGFLTFVLLMIVNGCSSDHDHFRGYDYDDYYYDTHYYYYDGYYYSDPDHHYRYDHDRNHYYYGRLEWKGEYNGYAIVLRENPYYGLVCYIDNYNVLGDQLGHHNLYDHEIMVKFAFVDHYEGKNWIHIYHIYYR